MAKALMKVVMKLVTSAINLILTPVNSLITGLFPNFSYYIGQFTTFCTTYVGGSLSWFTSILPPITRNILVFWLSFLVTYYTIIWSYTLIIKIFNKISIRLYKTLPK